ncbi:MAG TPA: ribbon-helix-helix domain-containing protein [Salinimicrobium sp.]|nr:ribbon-helix-helix domain-containing protein [Salinimicrobium sp.]
MATFTSSLPNDLLQQLDNISKQYGVAKNKIIEKALQIYLDQLNRAEYAKSYKMAGEDQDIMAIAEEGMEAYLINVEQEDLK